MFPRSRRPDKALKEAHAAARYLRLGAKVSCLILSQPAGPYNAGRGDGLDSAYFRPMTARGFTTKIPTHTRQRFMHDYTAGEINVLLAGPGDISA